MSIGLASPPVFTIRSAATIGIPGRSLKYTVRPFGSVNDTGVGNVTAPIAAGFGASFRHDSSGLTLSAPVPGATFGAGGVGTGAPRSGVPGTPKTTTRAEGLSEFCAKALTLAAFTAR